MIKKMIEQVREFHRSFGIEPFKGSPTKEQIKLRYDLFKEEFDEYLDSENLVDKADAIVDMLYIALGSVYLISGNKDIVTIIVEYDTRQCLSIIDKTNKLFLKHKKDMFVRNIIFEILTLAYNHKIIDILPELFDEVHSSNMSKLDDNGKPIINGENGVFDESKPLGKILKSANFREPDLKSILEKYGRLT